MQQLGLLQSTGARTVRCGELAFSEGQIGCAVLTKGSMVGAVGKSLSSTSMYAVVHDGHSSTEVIIIYITYSNYNNVQYNKV